MVLPALDGSDVVLLLVYGAVLAVPGLVVGALGGLRGWSLAAAAPLLTYGIVGTLGPWSHGVGLRWSPGTCLLCALAVALVVGGLRWVAGARSGTRWSPRGAGAALVPWRAPVHAAVAVCVLAASALGATSVLVGMRGLRVIPQDWDAAFHANGIRYVAATGDASVDGMARLNWAELPHGLFYPNAYHLVGAVVLQITGRDVPSVINAQTVLMPAMLALALTALVRRCGGRAVVAGAAALLVVAASPFYDMLWRGPLLNYATAVALMPVVAVAILDLLEAHGARARLLPAAVFVLAVAGVLELNPASLFTAGFFALPLVLARWLRRRSTVLPDLRILALVGIVTIAVCVQSLVGSLQSAASASADWPAHVSWAGAVAQFLLYSHATPSELTPYTATPQWWLVLPLAVGLVTVGRLRGLRWTLASAVVLFVFFGAAATSDAHWAQWMTRFWWNDDYRLVGAAVVPLAVIAAHGVGEVSRGVVALADRVPFGRARPADSPAPLLVRVAAPAALLVVLGLLSGGLYLARNEERMSRNAVDGPAISPAEVTGYAELGRLVPPQQRVMNDRGDGSVWMYALDGVRPVAAHYDATAIGPDSTLLAEGFDRYDTDPAVRAAAARLQVGWVAVGDGFLRPGASRQPGLVDLDRVRSLQLVWSNPGFRIYRLTPSG